ncbi:MAG: FG-GAP repeat protein [Candidatus Moduliflexus flocculans]|nr:FG-GAP repeat protein [Candidatus Moduliflexus flocculans]
MPSDGADYDNFGISVALGGDFAVVGSPGDDDEGTNAGAAYIFAKIEGGADGWGEVAKLVASDAVAGDLFGVSVDISGDYVVVGATGEDGAGTNRGAVYIFYRDQGGADAWGQVARVRAAGAADEDDFGISVAIDGDTLIVGAEGYDGDTNQEGAAYVYRKDQGGANVWGQVVRLVSDDPGDTDQYGFSVDISDDVAIVGSPGEDGAGSNRGAARVYARDLGGADAWGLVKKILAADQSDDSWFGTSVAVRGTRVVAGAPWADGGGTNRGAVYIFGQNEGGTDAWGQVKSLAASDTRDDDLFGFDVALYGSYRRGRLPVAGAGERSGAGLCFRRERGRNGQLGRGPTA